MGEVDYMGYARYMGARNPVAEGFNNLGETIDSNRKLKTLEGETARRNALVDMQIAEANRKNYLRDSLRNALSNQRDTFVPAQPSQEQLSAYTPEALDLAQGKLSATMQDPAGQPGQQVINPAYGQAQADLSLANAAPAIPAQTIKADPMKILFEYAMKDGDIKDMAGILTLDTTLKKMAAEAALHGSQEKAYQIEAKRNDILAQGKILHELKQADPTGNSIREYIRKNPEVFANVDPAQVGINQQGNIELVGNGYRTIITPDGKSHILKDEKPEETWGKPYNTTVGGRQALVQESSRGKVNSVVQDASTTLYDRRESDSANKPIYVSWINQVGQSQAASINRSELPALKAQLEATGVKEINTVDGNKASRTEVLIKPDKKGKGTTGLKAPNGGGASTASVGVTVVRTGVEKATGKRVEQLSDGTTRYAK